MSKYPIMMLVLVIAMLSPTLFADSLRPPLPKAKQSAGPNKCVEPVVEMRKNHFEYILHQRDRTVHEGIRTKQHSFTGCINCHVTANKSGEFPRHTSKEHFCSACHQFAAVNIDCFMCHNDRPDSAIKAIGQNFNTQNLNIKAIAQE